MYINKKISLLTVSFIFTILIIIIGLSHTNAFTKQNEPENKIKAIEASSSYPLMEKDWVINHRVNKKRIYVENIIPRFSFQGHSSKDINEFNGYIAVFVNGKWTMNANKSIFILKGMSQGKHRITLQLKKKDGSDYGIKKNIYVHIR